MLLEPDPSGTAALLTLDLSDDSLSGEKIAPVKPAKEAAEESEPEQVARWSPKAKTKAKSSKKANEETSEAKPESKSESKPRRRRRSTPSTVNLLLGVFDGEFWKSASEHILFVTIAFACVGALIGFLVGLVRSAAVAGLLFNWVGIPTLMLAYFMMTYPASCFWKIVVGSVAGGTDLDEWPESNMGDWAFDLMFVGYLVGLSFFISAGVGKLREMTIPDQLPSEAYWQLIGSEEEVNKVLELPKINGQKLVPGGVEMKSGRPVFRPGPGWWTAFGAFIAVFPIVVISCLDGDSPIFVPWSPRVLISLFKNALSWLASLLILTILFGAAMVVFAYGSAHAPFWTFTLCSPLAAAGLMLCGRLIGRLSWQIANS